MDASIDNAVAAYPVAMLFRACMGSYPYAKRRAYLLPETRLAGVKEDMLELRRFPYQWLVS